MMEKYGVERSNLPVTEEQSDVIFKLCAETNTEFPNIADAERADEVINQLMEKKASMRGK